MKKKKVNLLFVASNRAQSNKWCILIDRHRENQMMYRASRIWNIYYFKRCLSFTFTFTIK